MAANVYDFKSLGPKSGGTSDMKTWAVASGGTPPAITDGDIVVYADGYCTKVTNGGCASAGKYALARSTSTETASADGTVTVEYSTTGLLIRGVPTTASNLATAIKGDKVTLDVAAGVQTVDENDPNGVLVIEDYNSTTGTIDVVLPYAL